VVKVINAGFYTTIQDLGRFGFQKHGVPVSGAMDNYSSRMANALLDNKENDALLEITMSGPILQFCSDTAISIVGADFSPKLNNNPIMLNHAICVKENDVLSFGNSKYGFRCYLAVSGGFQTEIIMKSRSMYKEISSGFKMVENDELSILKHSVSTERKHATIRIDSNHFTTKKLEVFKGPEFELLSKIQQQQLLSEEFMVSKDNNRMAYQLVETLTNTLKPIITSLVLPGTVQLTPSGKLIVLMRDCQTTGGYPRVLQLSESAINILAQKFNGKTIHFKIKE
jgi:antagonist of KipI